MAVIIPKDMRGFRFAKAVPFDLNDVLMDIMLPNVFQRAILENRDLVATNIDASDIDGPINLLAESDRLIGFDGSTGQRLLEKLVKSSLITIGYKGTGRKDSDKQIEGIVPYSIASFKTGLPKIRTRLRSVDQFVYYLLLVEYGHDPQQVSKLLVDVFGSGVKVLGHPQSTFQRLDDNIDSLDIITDLSITYLEGFKSVKPREKPSIREIAQPLPGFQTRFGKDLYRYLWTYQKRMPTSVLISQVLTLISFEITVFTVKLLDAIPIMTSDPDSLPTAMTFDDDLATGPKLYLDMTGEVRGTSRMMAGTCVRRDLSSIDPFIYSTLQLRYLDSLRGKMMQNPSLRSRLIGAIDEDLTPVFLQSLLNLRTDPVLEMNLDALAGFDLQRIVQTSESEQTGDENGVLSPIDAKLESMVQQGLPLDGQVVRLLYETQVGNTRKNIQLWMTSVGGVNTSYGLINGRADRRSWAYAPPNDMLTVLIQLRAIDYKGWNPARSANPEPFSVPEFLEWLEDRFGIIVDRPPEGLGFDGPEHMAAARDNLRAMLRRLRQMGVFEDQSDDFSVQTLTPPYLEPAPAAPSTRHA